nr:hypothetical protein [Tanacetum cinerariifolium]
EYALEQALVQVNTSQSDDEFEEEDENAISAKLVDNLAPTAETLTTALTESFVLSA